MCVPYVLHVRVYFMLCVVINRIETRNSIELNRNQVEVIGREETMLDVDDCMLDIVVGIKSNLNRKLYRTRIIFNRNRNIRNRRTERSMQAVDRSGS